MSANAAMLHVEVQKSQSAKQELRCSLKVTNMRVYNLKSPVGCAEVSETNKLFYGKVDIF